MNHQNIFANESNKQLGRCSILPPEVKKELVEHVLKLESCMFGINTIDLRRLAFEIAEKNKIPHQFNKDVGVAGKKWYYQFIKCNPSLSLKLPEPTSMATATGFCKEKFVLFFNKLTELVDSTHTKNLEALVLARDQGVVMLSLPSHTTHRLQPLDRSFFKALNAKYNTACDKWMRTHPGRCITQYQVSQLFGKAYSKVVGMEIAINGFRDTGIWPVDSSVFREEDFVPCEIISGETSSNAKASQTDELILETISAHPVQTSSLERNPKKSRATLLKHNAHNDPLSNVTLLSSMKKTEQLQCLDIPIKALSPLPVRTSPLKRKKNNSNTTVLTSSPYKDALSARALLRPNKKIKQDRQCLKE
ncbi:uncharacterized protein LOC105847615 [Hydra vulgaris]|uniref:uncharacterized protein LOC105847615 n=1 Tax=Hydra vulgaris TaxID=6087 RepID=UPI001F5FA91D|nr:uncharacterized protein LOC105847615 [Hydra vulgaris]